MAVCFRRLWFKRNRKILLIMILCTLAICSSSFSFLLHLEISAPTKLMTWNYLFIICISRNDTKYRYYRPILFSRNIKSNIMNTSQIFSYLTNIANMLQIQTHTLIFCSRNNEVFSGNYQTLNYKCFLFMYLRINKYCIFRARPNMTL